VEVPANGWTLNENTAAVMDAAFLDCGWTISPVGH